MVHILITSHRLSQTWQGKLIEPAANRILRPNGILLRNTAQAVALAHELGYVADYVGDASDKVHSSDSKNLMYSSGGQEPDCQWCEKVTTLAK